MSLPAWIEIGYVAKARGLKGALRVRLYNTGSDLLEGLDQLYLEGPGDAPRRPYRLASSRTFDEFCEVSLEGVADRTRAEALTGAKVWVAGDRLPALEKDEYYHFQLIGLQAVDEDGRTIGRLEEIFSTPANDIYVVRGEVGELMVPAVGAYVRSIDLEAGTLTLSRVAELLEE